MKKIYFFLIALFVSLTMNAGEVTEAEALQKAQQFMKGKQFKQTNLRRAPSTANNAYYVFNAENKGGFIIVAGDDRMTDILGYSEHGNFDLSKAPSNVKWLMDYYAKVAKSLKDCNKSGGTRRAPANRVEVQPLIKTTWDQMAPYCNHCPTIKEGYLTPTGCVATAMAQVINFHMWPQTEVKAMAGYAIGDKEISALPAKKFNWYNMTDDDIAWLMRYCGQAVLMNYGVGESGASPSSIPYALISYFGFSKSTKLETRSDFSDTDWEETIYNEVNLGRPVIYSGFQSGGGSGHSFVVHGYRDGKFLVNWGWSGDCDGYFTLTNLAPNEYMDFSSDQNAVIGIQPLVADTDPSNGAGVREIDVKQAGTLSDYISESEKYTIRSLKLTGKLNGSDIRFIREMAGSDVMRNTTPGLLKELNLSGARIVEGGEPYCMDYYTSDDVIGESMFTFCAKLSKITLPNTVKSIERDAFYVSGLQSIIIPKSVTKIDPRGLGTYSWISWTGLSSIQVEEGNPVYRSENNAIYERATGKLIRGCFSTIIPEGVTCIGEYAFYGELLMDNIHLPESLTTIEDYAFADDWLLTLKIPKNVTNIGNSICYQCSRLTTISVDDNNKVYDSRNNCNAIIETATNTLLVGSSSADIPEGITTIADNAFAGVGFVKSIKLPQSLISIGNGAFSGTELKTIEIPSSVQVIGDDAFSNLNSVRLHSQEPIEINDYTFLIENTVLIVPEGTKTKYEAATGWKSFYKIIESSSLYSKTVNVTQAGTLFDLLSSDERKCLEKLVLTGELNGTDFKVIRDMAFADYPTESGSLKVLDISAAKIVEGGDLYISQANTLISELYNCKTLEEVILPSTLTEIGYAAFQGTSIDKIVIPKSVEKIGESLFYNNDRIKSISVEIGNPIYDSRDNCNAIIETATNKLIIGCNTTIIPESVTMIGNFAFEQSNIKEIKMPDGIKTVEAGAFGQNTNLTTVSIPKNVEEIGAYVFQGCFNIKSITVSPENSRYDSRDNCNAIIETSSNTLLQGCENTIIPNTVTSIGYQAFYEQVNLTSIEIPASITEIQGGAFYHCNNLNKVISHIKKPFAICQVFNTYTISESTLYVPYGTKAVYASTPGWDVFGNIIEMEPDDSYQGNSASIVIKDLGKHYAAVNGEVKIPVSITGEGINPITSIDYTITTGNNSKEYHLDVEPISYMMTAEVLIPFAADATIGEQAKTLKITKVNGMANECTENVSATGTLVTVAKKPKIIPVVEEYTGTWCGWCVKGIVGLNLLNKTFKNDVITIAIHDGTDDEPMMLPEYRSTSGSYPSCQINRGELMDPYFGSSNSIFGIKREVEAAQRGYALGGIEVNAEWTDDSQTAIDITTTTTFVEDVVSSPYQIGYVLLEDGVTGTGDAWAQSNYYFGSTTNDENLKVLTSKPSKITDMKYDHVPVAAWEPTIGVAGTIPTTITHDVPMEYTFRADISGNTRIQNKKKLTVVVLLIDKETGKIINANKYAMGGSFIPGDVNGDGLVNVTDIVATVNYIMEKPSDGFNKDAADLNGDGLVNVTDIVKMVSIIMSSDGASSRRAAATSSNLIISGNNIQLRNAETYTAAQFDINLSDGQSISNVVLNGSSNHDLNWKMIDANTCRVVVYSMTNAAFCVNDDNLFDVFMNGGQNATISNELLIKAEGTTGIDTIRREAENGKVYDLNGRQVKNPRKGLYIINGRKVVVK